MSRTAGRDAGDTKRGILDAAAGLIARRGSDVAITEIAEAAGVSKGGLLYHFPTKEVLLLAVAERLLTEFRDEVGRIAAAEPEGTPGRLARGYIEASFAEVHEDAVREQIAVSAHLAFEPAVRELSAADGKRWREDLMADGLAPEAVRHIVAATDGVSAAALWGAVLDSADCKALHRELMQATRV